MSKNHIIDLNQTFRTGIATAMQGVGAALAKGEDAWSSFKQGVLGILGDMLIQVGNAVILQAGAIEALKVAFQSLTGAPAFIAGAALIALGGALKSQAGSALSSAATGQNQSAPGIDDLNSAPIEQEQLNEPKTNVQVVVNGNVFDSEETGLRIVDLLNRSFDQQGVVVRGMA